MKKFLVSLAAVAAIALPVVAQAADEWGIEHEKVARFEAKVVDIACELTGNCPANCGNGKRQLGLLQKSGRLLLVPKNNDIFAGATEDLLPFCGKNIIADGLLIENPKMPFFQLQFKRLAPDGKWSRANWFTKNWAKNNPGKKGDQWFRHDARVKEALKDGGLLGVPGLKYKSE